MESKNKQTHRKEIGLVDPRGRVWGGGVGGSWSKVTRLPGIRKCWGYSGQHDNDS